MKNTCIDRSVFATTTAQRSLIIVIITHLRLLRESLNQVQEELRRVGLGEEGVDARPDSRGCRHVIGVGGCTDHQLVARRTALFTVSLLHAAQLSTVITAILYRHLYVRQNHIIGGAVVPLLERLLSEVR